MSVGLSSHQRRAVLALVLCPLLAACLPSRTRNVAESFAAPSAQVTIGTTLTFGSLDPASGDPGTELIAANLYQRPLRAVSGGGAVAAEATTCSFQDQTTYVCVLVPGQAFSNGDPVTAQDLTFSIRRAVRLGGPDIDALFSPMTSMVAGGNTVTFTLSTPDPTWPLALASSYAAIVDHRVFPKAKKLSSSKVVGSGPYQVSELAEDGSLTLTPNPHYGGSMHLNNARVTIKPEPDGAALVRDLTAGTIDVAAPSADPVVLRDLQAAAGTRAASGPAYDVRVLAFDEASMPGIGDAHRLAIRQAVALVVDRATIISVLYPGAAQPLPGDAPAPDVDAARTTLEDAGVTVPVEATLVYNDDHLGDERLAGELRSELDSTGLFQMKQQNVAWNEFRNGVASGKYGVYLMGGNQGPRPSVFQAGPSADVPFVPIWQRGLVLVAHNGVSGLNKSVATPGVIAIWNLGKSGAE